MTMYYLYPQYIKGEKSNMNTTFFDDFDHVYDTTGELAAIPKEPKKQSWSPPAVMQRISKMLQGYSWQPSPFTVIFLTALVIYAVAVYYGFMNFNAILYIFVVKYLPMLPY
jgi:hypothetical protein